MEKTKNNNLGKLSIVILWVVYLALAVVCGMLSMSQDSTSIIINVVLFTIVGVIFVFATLAIKKVLGICDDLAVATDKIKQDYDNKGLYLIDTYLADDAESLFKNQYLSEEYNKYLLEMKRLKAVSNGAYKCDIRDYINTDSINILGKKALLNLVPGIMTGLGILGTFIGLSIGLQNFNTETAAEISESIAPLMNGIKVAFHTSIYGMTFSLVYNWIFRQCFENSYNVVESFIASFDKYVTGNTENDNENQMVLLMQNLPRRIGEIINESMAPHFEKMNDILGTFAEKVDNRRMEGMDKLVKEFTKGLNESMGDNFEKLGEVLNRTSQLQEESNKKNEDILRKISGLSADVVHINELTAQTVEAMSGYITSVAELQVEVNKNYDKVNDQIAKYDEYSEKVQKYIDDLVEEEKELLNSISKLKNDTAEQLKTIIEIENTISTNANEIIANIQNNAEEYNKKLTESVNDQIEIISNTAKTALESIDEAQRKISERAVDSLELLDENAKDYSKELADEAKKQIDEIVSLASSTSGEMDNAAEAIQNAAKQFNGQMVTSLNKTFDVFDSNLTEITTHLSGTIADVRDVTDRVPETVKAAYEGMEDSFKQLQDGYNSMIHAMDTMERNLNLLAEKQAETVKKGN